jgi:hypothetical protein
MLRRSILILILFIGLGMSLSAMRVYTFLKNGNYIHDVILDISSRTGKIDFQRTQPVFGNQVWMINFIDNQWNFPGDRRLLSHNTDTIFLRNGQRMNVTIVDFSSRQRKFEFSNGGKVHESNIARIYLCCDKLPQAYQKLLHQSQPNNSNRNAIRGNNRQQSNQNHNRYSTSYVVDGRVVESPLTYINRTKTAFENGLQINTKDLWMINFQENRMNYAQELRQLNKRLDTIFLRDGEVIYDKVIDFSKRRGTFRFQGLEPIHESEIVRIYFCCNKMPRKRINNSRRRSNNRRYQR